MPDEVEVTITPEEPAAEPAISETDVQHEGRIARLDTICQTIETQQKEILTAISSLASSQQSAESTAAAAVEIAAEANQTAADALSEAEAAAEVKEEPQIDVVPMPQPEPETPPEPEIKRPIRYL